MNNGLLAAGLLLCSNTFMTVAWYGPLRSPDRPLWIAMSFGLIMAAVPIGWKK